LSITQYRHQKSERPRLAFHFPNPFFEPRFDPQGQYFGRPES
jgi:hypothetical protein